MNIVGKGTVTSTVSGTNTTYTAIPNTDYKFKYFTYGGTNYTDNPITVPTDTDITVTFYCSIESYLKGKVGFDIPDNNLNSILLDRGISSDSDITEMTAQSKDLLYADVLMFGATLPSQYGSIQDSDGGWTHQEGASTINAADKKRFETIAEGIYKRYNDGKYRSTVNIIHIW